MALHRLPPGLLDSAVTVASGQVSLEPMPGRVLQAVGVRQQLGANVFSCLARSSPFDCSERSTVGCGPGSPLSGQSLRSCTVILPHPYLLGASERRGRETHPGL